MSYFQNEFKKHKYIDVGDNILIHIGHFKYSVGIGPIEIKTFEDGISFGNDLINKYHKHVTWRLLVDDIGLDLEKRKQIKEKFLLPKAYTEILQNNNVSDDKVEVIFESVVRNRASYILKKKSDQLPGKDKLNKEVLSFDKVCEYERCVPQSDHAKQNTEDREVYSVIDPYSGIPLILKEGPSPAKCNLIIACSYYEGSMNFDSIISFYNALWEQRMHYGAMVASLLFGIKKPIIDFYYYQSNEKPKMVVNNAEEFKYNFEREKLGLVKELLKSDIRQELKDEYLSNLEGIDDIETFNIINKNIKKLINK